MSRIYFHSPSGTAELHGSERAYMGIAVNDMAFAILVPHKTREERETWLKVLPKDCDLQPDRMESSDPLALLRWFKSLETWLSVNLSREPDLRFDGRGTEMKVSPWTVQLNTAVATGSPYLALMARLHATCEIHGWVDGPNRAWLADVMERGRAEHIFRPNQGWEKVITLLRARADEPVVTSYSVCDEFPNYGIARQSREYPSLPAEATDEEKEDSFYALTPEQQWRLSMDALRAKEPRSRLEMRPDTLTTQGFRDAVSAFEYRNWLNTL